MLALTIRQPWAWAIFHAGKDIENRGWRPRNINPGERIAIHAAAKLAENYPLHVERINQVIDALAGRDQRRVPRIETLPRGVMLGTVVVARFTPATGNTDSPWADGLARWARWHWHLEDPRLMSPRVKCRGAQMLWRCDEATSAWGALT